MTRVLVADDDRDLTDILASFLRNRGYEVSTATNGARLLKCLEDETVDVVLMDLHMGDIDGLELIDEIRARERDVPVVVLTGDTGVPSAVKAIKKGAYDYLTKPCANDEIALVIERAVKENSLRREVDVLRQRLTRDLPPDQIIGKSAGMVKMLEAVERVAPTDLTVILQGESGTGKELAARRVHQLSRRRTEDFVAVDCGALTESLAESELFGHEKGAFTGAHGRKLGLLELSLGGTLFLDEIGNLPLSLQTKFLRAVQERLFRRVGGTKDIPFQGRVVVATNTDLAEAVRRGKFREDLFHRLNQFVITLPPLRERQEDIPSLADYFLREANRTLRKQVSSFSDEALEVLKRHVWPGNVRELRNLVTRAVLSAEGVVREKDLELRSRGTMGEDVGRRPRGSGVTLRSQASATEKQIILETLKRTAGNKVKAAKLLGINRMTLYLKLKKHKIAHR